jgi:carboxymethylenebutenolidase
MYHRTAPAGFSVAYDNYSALAPHMSATKRETIEADEQAAYDWLRSNLGTAPIGAIGFCMGGGLAFSAALLLPVSCAISFYGGNIPAGPRGPGLLDRAASLRAPVLLFWGGLDKHITSEQVNSVTNALRVAHKPFVNVDFSDADHGFMCDERPSYNPVAAAQAWPLTLAFLKTHTESAEKAKTA